MSLEKSLFRKIKNTFSAVALASLLSACPHPTSPSPYVVNNPSTTQNNEEDTNSPTQNNSYNYTTTFTLAASQNVKSSLGGLVEVNDLNSAINGAQLEISANSLKSDLTISISEVNNPPELPAGLNYVGPPLDLKPDGTIFNSPSTITIPFNNQFLSDAGISDDSKLKLYSYDKSSRTWTEIKGIMTNSSNDTITALINHFSYYAITCMDAISPSNLGVPQPGDLLYCLGSIFSDKGHGWRPGHVGIYVGEKTWNGQQYNVIEALGDGVQRRYYNPISKFSNGSIYMGAREPKDFTLTSNQRRLIVEYAEEQIGKPYAWIQTTAGVLFGLAKGSLVKGGLGSFNCVGLAEAAYEYAGANNGEGLVPELQEETGAGDISGALTPAEQYNYTKSATGIPPSTGSNGLEKILFQSNREGSSAIYVMNSDGTDVERLTDPSYASESPKWDKQRDKIIFVSNKDTSFGQEWNSRYEIWSMNSDGTNSTRLTYNSFYDHNPCWSPDGTKIVFISNRDKVATSYDRQLYIMNADGSNQNKLSSDNFYAEEPSFSPDGTKIVFDGYNGIYVLNLSNKFRKKLNSDNVNVYNPSWSSYWGKILFTSREDNQIYTIDINGNKNLLINSSGMNWYPSWSKDESKILFSSNRNGNWEVYSIYYDGHGLTNLTNNSFTDISPN